MRLIDADALGEIVQTGLRSNPHEDRRARAIHQAEYIHFLDIIRRAPTIAPPPNDPLTLEELREMSGEPVWWWNTSAKPVCTICVSDRFMMEPMFANYDFMSEDTLKLTKYKWLRKCGYKPYRSKPEEGA